MPENNTEHDIMSEAGFGSGADDATEDTTQDIETEVEETPAKASDTSADDVEEQSIKAADTVDPRDRTQRQQSETRLPSRRYVDYNYNEKGDVIDPKTGKVMYEANTPANRMFRELRNTQFKASKMDKDLRKAIELGRGFETKANAYETTFAEAKEAGLTAEDTMRAVRVFSALKKEPVKTLRYLLTKAQADGTDLADIFENVQSLQTSGIKAMIDERLKPLTERREADASEQQVRVRAAEETEAFLEEFPEAELHTDVIVGMIHDATEQGKKLPVRDAYTQLLNYCAQNGLDIRRALKPQLEARAGTRRTQQRPVPRGNGGGRGFTPRDEAQPFRERSNRDTVKEAMAEAGFNFED